MNSFNLKSLSMQIIVKAEAKELLRARQWWAQLETQWKMAYNEAVFGIGPTLEPPREEALMVLLVRADTLRFAGPGAVQPNLSIFLTNLSGLVPLYQLRYLSLSHSRVRSVQELQRHTRLQYLYLYDNALESLAGIEGMRELQELYVQNNRLRDIEAVRYLTNLQKLYITGNELQHLRGLTTAHSDTLKRCYVLPNNALAGKEIIRVQNDYGIICRTG